MRDITNTPLLSLMPRLLRQDASAKAMCRALQRQLDGLIGQINKAMIYVAIDDLSEPVLDELARDLHVDFYQVEDDIAVKRRLVKSSLVLHGTKGTPGAVERLASEVFDDGRVEEWWEYGADPYHFNVVTTNQAVTTTRALAFIEALKTVKNTRSWLDAVILASTEGMGLYVGIPTHHIDYETIRQVG